ncbi:MAG: DUF2382 domain-containing protein [Paracoccus sp. (in: a-proteobacteria)]|nr:DUF2382 domain-containing protein [Paracoccus sp. (in: a-proteobacteria)]
MPPARMRDIIEIAEESARIERHVRDRGGVRIETRTTEVNELIPVDLRSRNVDVVRVPVNKLVSEVPGIREENGVTIIPVLEERVVVRTDLVLVEEIHVIQTDTTERFDIPVTRHVQQAFETPLPPSDDNPV